MDANRRIRMADEVRAKVARLPSLPTAKLRSVWEEVFVSPAHPKVRREVMIPILAYRIQELAYGGLQKETITRLQKVGRELEKAPEGLKSGQMKTGTRLLRHWGGDTHEVTVTDDGYSYRGKVYKSLSSVARQITGTRWSGPLFFGLTANGEEKAGTQNA
jgi:hypothetical protein